VPVVAAGNEGHVLPDGGLARALRGGRATDVATDWPLWVQVSGARAVPFRAAFLPEVAEVAAAAESAAGSLVPDWFGAQPVEVAETQAEATAIEVTPPVVWVMRAEVPVNARRPPEAPANAAARVSAPQSPEAGSAAAGDPPPGNGGLVTSDRASAQRPALWLASVVGTAIGSSNSSVRLDRVMTDRRSPGVAVRF
jgi:hypothetical protein